MDFRLLGPLLVQAEGEGVPLGGPRQRLVLALLLLSANDVVSVDQLVYGVWGDEPPPAARGALYAYVSRLRAALGRGRIEQRAGGYVLRAERNELDAGRFEAHLAEARRLLGPDPGAAAVALDEALALWRGPVLADLADEPSLRAEVARLDELRLAALEARVAARLAIGRHAEVIADLERLLSEHPLRERLWAQLMVALYRSGRQSDALKAYLRARRLLADQLGVDPSPDLERLQQQILRHESVLSVQREAIRGYEIHERVGEGAFGTVYRAGQPGLGREVAIKLIHQRLANDADFIRRFEQEAQLVAGLEHPHVVPLYDYWREPGSAYLVMRYLRGGNLGERIAAGGPLAPTDAVRLVDQVAAALAAAHRQGIVHRDVRPPNILFDEDDNAYLSDFGIAKRGLAAAGATEITSTGLAYYVAPEEITGEPVSPATDIYSLGLIVFELLAGRHPLSDTTPDEAIDRHLRGALPSLTSLRPDLPAAVDAVVARATARQASSRYPDPLAFADALRSAFAEVDAAATQAEIEVRTPYKGLRPYAEADADDFFGREAVVERLTSRLAERSAGAAFLGILGPSGSGKSSVVRAGVIPALRRGAVPGSDRWFVTDMHPGSHPFDELAEALLRVAVGRPTDLARRLARDPASLPTAVAELLPAPDAELLLVVDQFEEVFTLTSEDERVAFLDAIAGAVAKPGGQLRVVITLRADFFDRPLLYRAFGDLLAARTEVVTPLSSDELARAVARPAERVGLNIEPALLAQIVADAMQSAGSLPLLQYALSVLFERREGRTLTLAAYRQIGGLAGALGRRADQVVARLDPAGQESVRQLFLRLVTITEDGSADVRRRVLLTELSGLEQSPGVMRRVLDAFGRHRLLSFDRDPLTRSPTAEVAHEALLREWGRLRGWIRSAWDDVRTHRLLAAAVAEWHAGDRDLSFLPRGNRLERFETWAASSGLMLTDDEGAFLHAAVALRTAEQAEQEARQAREAALERRSRRRLRALAAVMSVAAVVAGGLSLYAFHQQRLASARELAAGAVANLEVDPELSILLARQAVDTSRGLGGSVLPEAEEALHRGVAASRIVHRIAQPGGVVDWSPDGSTFLVTGARPVIELTASEDAETNVVSLYDRASGELVRSWAAQAAGVNEGVFSPQGGFVASAGKDGTVVLWDRSGSPVRTLPGPDGWVWGLSFSADGRYLAGIWSGRAWSSALVWNVEDGELVRRIDGLASGDLAAQDTSLDADGGRVAVAVMSASRTRVYDVATGRAVSSLLPPDAERDPWGWSAVAWRPDDSLLAAAQADTVRIYDRAGGEQLYAFRAGAGWVSSLAWSADGSRLLVANTDGSATLWMVGPDSAKVVVALASQSSGLIGAALSPDGSLAVTADAAGEVALWDMTDAGTAEWLNLPAEPTWLSTVIFGRDGQTILGSLPGAKLGIWDAATGRELMIIEGHGRAQGEEGLPSIASVSIHPDGKRIVTGGRDNMVRLWDAATGTHAGMFAGHADWIEDTQFSPRGDLLATASLDGSVRLVDIATLRQTRVLAHDDGVLAARFTPDGSVLVSGSVDGTVRVWDPYTGELRRRIEVGWQVRDVGLDPEGRLIGVGGDGGAALYDLSSGQLLRTVTGQSGEVWAVRFSPDGRQVATGGIDGTIRLWDPATGIVRLRLFQERVDDLAFSADGTRLAAIGDGLIRIWALDIDDLLSISARNVARGLTDEECRQYLHRPCQ